MALGLVCVALLLGSTQQRPVFTPVGVVDVPRIITGSAHVQATIEKASLSAKSLREQISAKQVRFLALQQELKVKTSKLSNEERQRRQTELNQLQASMTALSKRLMEELSKAQDNALPPLELQINKIIEELAAARGMTMVIQVENTVYHLPQTDLTEDVIKQIDATP